MREGPVVDKSLASRWGRLAFRGAALVAGFLLLQASNCSDNVGTSSTGPSTFRVSTGANDLQADGNSTAPTVTADGRYVAFVSQANNLASQPTGFREVFVKDRLTGNVTNVSRLASAMGPADCDLPFISSDGQWVVFQSKTDYNNPAPATNVNILVSDFPPGNLPAPLLAPPPDHDATNGSICENASHVWCVFQSAATNIPGIANPTASLQIFAMDFKFGGVPGFQLVSHSTAGTTSIPANFSRNPVISGDGSTIAFTSAANDLITGGGPSMEAVYVGTPVATLGTIALVSTAAGPPVPNQNGVCLKPSISTNGNLVAFTSKATNLVLGEPGHDVIVRNISAQTTTLVATDAHFLVGLPGNIGFPLGLSDTGRFVAYTSHTDHQIYFVDMLGGSSLASAGPTGMAGDQISIGAVLSPDGRWLFWQSAADNLVLEDSNAAFDVFGRGPYP